MIIDSPSSDTEIVARFMHDMQSLRLLRVYASIQGLPRPTEIVKVLRNTCTRTLVMKHFKLVCRVVTRAGEGIMTYYEWADEYSRKNDILWLDGTSLVANLRE